MGATLTYKKQPFITIPTHEALRSVGVGDWKKVRKGGKDLHFKVSGATFGKAHFRSDSVIVIARFSTLKHIRMQRILTKDLIPGKEKAQIHEVWQKLMDEVLEEVFTRVFSIKQTSDEA